MKVLVCWLISASVAWADTAVHFRPLIQALPDVPIGWTATEPDGSTTQIAGFSASVAERFYRNGSDPEASTVQVRIVDYTGQERVIQTITGAWNSIQVDSSEGYSKPVIIDEQKAYESYENAEQDGTLVMFLNNQFLVEITISNLPASELQSWVKAIKRNSLKHL